MYNVWLYGYCMCSVFSVQCIGVHSSLFESDGWWFDVDERSDIVRFLDLHVWLYIV